MFLLPTDGQRKWQVVRGPLLHAHVKVFEFNNNTKKFTVFKIDFDFILT